MKTRRTMYNSVLAVRQSLEKWLWGHDMSNRGACVRLAIDEWIPNFAAGAGDLDAWLGHDAANALLMNMSFAYDVVLPMYRQLQQGGYQAITPADRDECERIFDHLGVSCELMKARLRFGSQAERRVVEGTIQDLADRVNKEVSTLRAYDLSPALVRSNGHGGKRSVYDLAKAEEIVHGNGRKKNGKRARSRLRT